MKTYKAWGHTEHNCLCVIGELNQLLSFSHFVVQKGVYQKNPETFNRVLVTVYGRIGNVAISVIDAQLISLEKCVLSYQNGYKGA